MTKNQIYVGSKEIKIIDGDISFNVLIQYPTKEPSSPTKFGPYEMDVSVNAPIMEGHFPLTIISHGSGGSHLIYRTISTHLAKNGYIVAMVEHYGNNRNNNELEESEENLILRPKHISLTIDKLILDQMFGEHLVQNKIAVIGHSMGGYTALALAGGTPRTKEGKPINAPHDSRIKAIVLMAPGAGWFMKGLDNVKTPILLLTAEHDPYTPSWNTDVILSSIPDKSLVTVNQIKNAGHFSFISPFPEPMKNPHFLPSTDPEGFDREKFHTQLPEEILSFLNQKLL